MLLDEQDAEDLLPSIALPAQAGRPDDLFRSALFARWAGAPLAVEFMAGLQVHGERVVPATRLPVTVDEATLYVPSRSELADVLRRFGRAKDLARAALL